MSRKSTLVLLHAMGSSHAMWDAQVAELAGEYDILTPDLPGHGLNKTRFTMDTAAEQVLSVIRTNTSGRVHVIGASLGASVALHVALAAPARVAGLLLSGAMVDVPRWTIRTQRLVTRLAPVQGLAVASARAVNPARPGDRDALITDIIRAGKRTQLDALRALVKDDVRRRLGRITVPSLVCCGDRDRVNLPSMEVLAAEIPHATKRLIPDADHLWNLQRPEDCTKLIREFVTEHPS
ncbi:alpha/beta fold hydrolase [Stackebrandtia nassauensis]|uniref:Alpha/beta hydrolase fold protein n=1 Tax=Stackebrandtia nassauensis (strain DSM 44728 / CIP 108903 / NRRL B-16338 / NBRC 102104 / LLR-40K-21) TaxID=446470 RepID=D3Q8D8_STANL|nr:alpha/beta fold hydrolase [Stackebrandtia nassauensis]ADD42512.1 alpha/beta hydrolase fold protein [Stackebrandtia nassauensis DSM 44728]